MKKLILLSAVILASLSFGISQTVSDINFYQNGQKIEVSYSISGALFYQKFTIDLYVSIDGGKTFKGPLKNVSGDVGLGIIEGNNKKIEWDVYKEMPDFGGQVVFDVRAIILDEKVKRHFYIGYKGSYTAPLGLIVGMTGKTGFYVSTRINPDYFSEYQYETDGETITDYNNNGYYSFTKNDKTQRLSVTAGLQFQVGRKWHWYAGAGYAINNLLWELDEYDYPAQKTGTAWALHTGESFSGVELETGFMVEMNSLYLSGGITSPGLKSLEAVLSLGILLNK